MMIFEVGFIFAVMEASLILPLILEVEMVKLKDISAHLLSNVQLEVQLSI